MLNLVCYVSLCEGLRAGAGSLSYIVHVDCCGLSTIVIKKIIIIIIIIIVRCRLHFFQEHIYLIGRHATSASMVSGHRFIRFKMLDLLRCQEFPNVLCNFNV